MSRRAVGSPEIVPLIGLAEQEGAEVAHGVGAALAPAHASPLQSLSDEPLAAGFHRSGADLPPHGPVARIVHLMLMVAEVLQLLVMDLAARRPELMDAIHEEAQRRLGRIPDPVPAQ